MELLNNPTYFWGFISISMVVLAIWLYRRAQHRNSAENELFDNMDDAYFESNPLLDNEDKLSNMEHTVEPPYEPVTSDNDHLEQIDNVNDEVIQTPTEKEPPQPIKNIRPEPELIVALFVLPNNEEGFLGTDIFTVLQDQNMSYGKMEIFHHYGVGEIKVKHSIFSVANILNPGTFNPKEMDQFRSAGLVFFMQLPGAFGGRVAFELMLNTAKRVAESLEGTLTNEQQYILDQEMIEAFREQITQYELEKEEQAG